MSSFQPLSDQVLVKVLPFEDRVKSIWVPETVDRGRLPIRQGVVVKVGCGDWIAPKCNCECHGGVLGSRGCGMCGGTGYREHERTDFVVKPGDKILFHPRYWAETEIDGEPHVVLHEDQHILAIIE